MTIAAASCGCRCGKQWLNLVHGACLSIRPFKATTLASEPALPSFFAINFIALNYGTPTSLPTAFEPVILPRLLALG